jgi:DNA-binding NtrC family response regulator
MPVLLIDDEEQILLSYSVFLRSSGIDDVIAVSDSRKVMPLLSRKKISSIVLDIVMPHLSGKDLLQKIRMKHPDIPVIVMTATNEIETAVECMKEGAFDYLGFVSSVQNALQVIELREEVLALRKQMSEDSLDNPDAFSEIVTGSKRMIAIFRYAEAIAKTSRPVCITGETGTGKELLARAIYKASRVKGRFVAVNVAGLDDTMFSDTLFGHKKGAFTGADHDRRGLIAEASGGVLLLDEIGDLNENSQLKLLRLLEEQKYYPLGSDVSHVSNVRIISTTNKDLEEQIRQNRFRQDLYYRLASHLIHLPPLHQRTEDIPLLFKHFLAQAAESLGKKEPSYAREIITLLSNCRFPGNIRELQGKIYDAVARHRSGIMSLSLFREILSGNRTDESINNALTEARNIDAPFLITDTFPTLKESETYLIAEALRRADGNQGIAASMLGISRQALNKRLKRKSQS